jgi:hypothetical protein
MSSHNSNDFSNNPLLTQILQRTPCQDTLHYQIYLSSNRATEKELKPIQLEFDESLRPFIKNYLWHKEAMNSHIKTFPAKEIGENNVCHISGSISVGDNVEDELFILFLLFQYSSRNPNMIVHVADNDGELLAIEAGHLLPAWLTPNNSQYRIYIFQGIVHIIDKQFTELTLVKSLQIIENADIPTAAHTNIQKYFQDKFADYPEVIYQHNDHRNKVILPLATYEILQAKPQLISKLVHTLLFRDSTDNKHANKLELLLPQANQRKASSGNRSSERSAGFSHPIRLVAASVRFTRCLYAQFLFQLQHAPISPRILRYFPQFPAVSGKKEALHKGILLTMALEIYLQQLISRRRRQAEQQSNASTHALLIAKLQEIMNSLQDLGGEDEGAMTRLLLKEHRAGWLSYRNKLIQMGFLPDPPSPKQLKQAVMQYLKLLLHKQSQRSNSNSGSERLSEEEVADLAVIEKSLAAVEGLEGSQRAELYVNSLPCYDSLAESCSEEWLNMTMEELEEILKQREAESGLNMKTSATAAPADNSSQRGADMNDILQEMNNFLGKESDYEGVEIESKDSDSSGDEELNSEEEAEIQQEIVEMETQLAAAGIINNCPPSSVAMPSDKMKQLNADYSVLHNLLSSLSEQQRHGLAGGPVASLFNSLGINLPPNSDVDKQHNKTKKSKQSGTILD